MPFSISYTRFIALLFAVSFAFIQGCGGGGGSTQNPSSINTTPAAINDEITVSKDASNVRIDVLANDGFGLNGIAAKAIVITQQPAQGVASVDDNRTPAVQEDDSVRYSPAAEAFGTDTLRYQIEDIDGETASAQAIITLEKRLVALEEDEVLTKRSVDCAFYDDQYERSSVRDVGESEDFSMAVTVHGTNVLCSIQSNGIPNHDFNDGTGTFATATQEQSHRFTIVRNPTMAASVTDLSQTRFDAVMLNGVVLDLLSAGCYRPNSTNPVPDGDGNIPIGCNATVDSWITDPLSPLNNFVTDTHNAHTQPDGTYHYHGNPNALFDNMPSSEGSPVIGFAADGFPIFGSYFYDGSSVRKATSSYRLKSGTRGAQSNDPPNPGDSYDGMYIDDYEYVENLGDLDECNGMTVDSQYGYYVTDTYPWVLKCFKGTPNLSFDKI